MQMQTQKVTINCTGIHVAGLEEIANVLVSNNLDLRHEIHTITVNQKGDVLGKFHPDYHIININLDPHIEDALNRIMEEEGCIAFRATLYHGIITTLCHELIHACGEEDCQKIHKVDWKMAMNLLAQINWDPFKQDFGEVLNEEIHTIESSFRHNPETVWEQLQVNCLKDKAVCHDAEGKGLTFAEFAKTIPENENHEVIKADTLPVSKPESKPEKQQTPAISRQEVVESVLKACHNYFYEKCEFSLDSDVPYLNSAAVLEPLKLNHITGFSSVIVSMDTFNEFGAAVMNEPVTTFVRGMLTKSGMPFYRLKIDIGEGKTVTRTIMPVNPNKVVNNRLTTWAEDAHKGILRSGVFDEKNSVTCEIVNLGAKTEIKLWS